MFARVNAPLCPDCIKDEEVAFQKLREYLNDNPSNRIATVSKDTGVPMKRILKYIQEGRIEMSVGMVEDNLLACARCGTSITVGSLCSQCLVSYNQTLQGMKEEAQQRPKNRGTGMHIAKSDEDKKRR